MKEIKILARFMPDNSQIHSNLDCVQMAIPSALRILISCLSKAYLESSTPSDFKKKLAIVINSQIEKNKEDEIATEPIPEPKPEIKLTQSQETAIANIFTWLKSNQQVFRLSGYAGTGKSFLMSELLLRSQYKRIVCAAPTNKAARNLRKILQSRGVDVTSTTIARLLKQQPEIDPETGNQLFVANTPPDLSIYDLVVFDEYSMIDKKNFGEITTALAIAPRTKALFLGDPAQLPPINEVQSQVVDLNLQYQSTLTEIVRYDGEIAKVAEIIRSDDNYRYKAYPFRSTEDNTISVVMRSQLNDIYQEFFLSDEFKTNPDFFRVLAYRNKTCDRTNQHIRTLIHGENLKAYNIGDILISKAPLFRDDSSFLYGSKMIANNSEEMIVIGEADLQSKVVNKISFNYHIVPVITLDGLEFEAWILTPESKVIFEKHLQDVRKEAIKDYGLWAGKYYPAIKAFDDLVFAYCLTTHKAQGSSIDYVLLDLPDLMLSDTKQKMIYTALTRAKTKAFILS